MKDYLAIAAIAFLSFGASWLIQASADEPLDPETAAHIVMAKAYLPAARIQTAGATAIQALERTGVVEQLKGGWYLLVHKERR